MAPEKAAPEKISPEKIAPEKIAPEKIAPEKIAPEKIGPARLQQVEDALLAAAVARHPDSGRAIAHLLDDVEHLPAGHPNRQLTPLRRHHQLERMDELLIEAMIRTHPNRDSAIDRLFADAVSDSSTDEDEQLERAMFDMQIDNDFDGMS